MIRPGPPWIERNAYPGGIVLHIYTATVPPLLLLRTLTGRDGDPVEAKAEHDANVVRSLIAADTPVCIVAYDGDTGERMNPQGLAGGR